MGWDLLHPLLTEAIREDCTPIIFTSKGRPVKTLQGLKRSPEATRTNWTNYRCMGSSTGAYLSICELARHSTMIYPRFFSGSFFFNHQSPGSQPTSDSCPCPEMSESYDRYYLGRESYRFASLVSPEPSMSVSPFRTPSQ